MRTAQTLQYQVQEDLTDCGLIALGWFAEENGHQSLLIGNLGGSHWNAFKSSNFFDDGNADPMNRWTQAMLSPVADKHRCEVRYPFGEKLWPFQKWTAAAMGIRPSPIGLFIHPNYGLWVALRGALVFSYDFEIPNPEPAEHPCETCSDKPCLVSCPVSAFSSDGFDVASCRKFVSSTEGENCQYNGCLARLSCPVGQEFAYDSDQQAFHMAAFYSA